MGTLGGKGLIIHKRFAHNGHIIAELCQLNNAFTIPKGIKEDLV